MGEDEKSLGPTPQQSRILWNAVTALALMALLGVASLVFLGFITFLSWAYPVLLPLGVAVIIALVLEPVVNFAQRRGLERRSATLGVCALAVVAFLIFWAFLLPPLFVEMGSFFGKLPGWIDEGFNKLESLENYPMGAARPATNAATAATDTNQAMATAPAGVTNLTPEPTTNAVPSPAPQPAAVTVDSSSNWFVNVVLFLCVALILSVALSPLLAFAGRHDIPPRSATLGICAAGIVVFFILRATLGPWLSGIESVQPPANPVPAANFTTNGAPNVPAHPATTSRPRHSDFAVKYVRPLLSHTQFQDWMRQNLPALEQSLYQKLVHLVSGAAGPVGQALGVALGFGFVPIYVYYFLADQDRITRHWPDYVPLRESALRREVVSVLSEINEVLVRYFRGQIIVASIDGLLTGIGLTMIGIPYSLMLGVITGALSLVPFLGIIASILPALLLGFISGVGLFKPIGVLVVFASVQLIESMLVTPRVQAQSTGLHPLTIIIGILFWSLLLPGLLGPVVAVPLTCAVVVLMRRYIWQARRPSRAG